LVCVTYKLGIGINVLKLPPHSTCCSSHHTCFIICAISLSLSTSFSAEQTTPNCCRSTLEMASAVVPPSISLKTKESLLQCVGFVYITRRINDLAMGSNIFFTTHTKKHLHHHNKDTKSSQFLFP
jgi:hypothetical protein